MWYWGRFSPSTSVSPANHHSTNFYVITITLVCHMLPSLHLRLIVSNLLCILINWFRPNSFSLSLFQHQEFSLYSENCFFLDIKLPFALALVFRSIAFDKRRGTLFIARYQMSSSLLRLFWEHCSRATKLLANVPKAHSYTCIPQM
jgi:hypothetical protein